MGSFIAWKRNEPLPQSVRQVFSKKGFEEIHEVQIGEYHLAYADKQLLKYPCLHQEAAFSLLLMGTAILPHCTAEESLKELAARYNASGTLDTSDALGNYLIVLFAGHHVSFYTDAANGYSLYFHRQGIWSDSQLALVHALRAFGAPTSWAFDQLNYNLSLGFLFGENTLFKDVLRFDNALHDSANEWKYISQAHPETASIQTPKNTDEALALQRAAIQQVFEAASPALKRNGILCGLTAGLDSRLMALCAQTFVPGATVKAFTNTQSAESIQVRLAQQIAEVLKFEFFVHQYNGSCLDIESNLYFNDGLIRIYHIWLEESKSRASAQKLFAERAILLTGVGGEHYRNSTFTSSRSARFEEWFKTEFIRRLVGKPFKRAESERRMIRELLHYVRQKLGSSADANWSRAEAERFLQHIFNPAVRLVRNNIENQMNITLSPFTEPLAIHAAQLAEPFTREHLSFEVRLIQAISASCDHIPLDYGFAPRERIPAGYRRRMWLHRWIPPRAVQSMHHVLRKRKERYPTKLMQLPRAAEALEAVRALPLQVNLDTLLHSELMAPLVFELGFLILTLNDVVLQDDSIH